MIRKKATFVIIKANQLRISNKIRLYLDKDINSRVNVQNIFLFGNILLVNFVIKIMLQFMIEKRQNAFYHQFECSSAAN